VLGSALYMDFSWCLNQNQFSDCTLIIVPDNTVSDIVQAPVRCTLCHVIDDSVRKQVLGRYNVHRVILATASSYFKALFDEKWNDGQNSVIQLTVRKDEKSAAEIMLQHIYSGTIIERDEHKLLDCMILANRYQVNNCVASCADCLTKAGTDGMSIELMMRILSLPTVLKQVSEFRSLLTAAESKLVHLYEDMEQAWTTDSLRQLFVSLPCDAVKLLATSDALKVASENVVFVAVSSWLMYNRAHELCSSHEVFELLDCIRLVQLSTTFLCDIAHNIKLFADCCGFQVRPIPRLPRPRAAKCMVRSSCTLCLARQHHTHWGRAVVYPGVFMHMCPGGTCRTKSCLVHCVQHQLFSFHTRPPATKMSLPPPVKPAPAVTNPPFCPFASTGGAAAGAAVPTQLPRRKALARGVPDHALAGPKGQLPSGAPQLQLGAGRAGAAACFAAAGHSKQPRPSQLVLTIPVLRRRVLAAERVRAAEQRARA
jgi:hypothetical protein